MTLIDGVLLIILIALIVYAFVYIWFIKDYDV